MKVLIACEFSGTVRDAFSNMGHDAWSCDLLPDESSSLWHIQGDCVPILDRGWDLIIMHPPCTALCVSGNRWYGRGCSKHGECQAAIEWTMSLWERGIALAPSVAMENPVGVLPLKPSQYIQPWQFGHGETKKTGLWLHNLPQLTPTNIVAGRSNRIHMMPPSPDRWKQRSKTYPGIAAAMASQWGRIK